MPTLPTEDALMAEPVKPEPAVEVESEMQADGSVETSVETEVPVEPAAPVVDPAAEKLAAVEAELESIRSAYFAVGAEKDVLVGQLSAAQTQLAAAQSALAPLQEELLVMRDRLMGYELGAALIETGLPAQTGALIRTLYATALRDGTYMGIGEWLKAGLADPNSPMAALALMRGGAMPDPRASAPPMDSGASAPSLMPSPQFRRTY